MSELTYEDFKQRINIQEEGRHPLSLLRALGQQWPPHSW